MSTRTLLVLGLTWGLVGTAGAALAQQPSLAEVAKQEAVRRKNVESGKRVYTNQDLDKGRPLTTGAVAKVPAPAAEAAPQEPESEAEAEQGPQDEASALAMSANPGEDEKPAADGPEITNLRLALASATDSARDALGDVDKANVTIVNLFDEAQRTAAVATRDARLADYRKYQTEIDALSKQIADLEAAHKKAKAAKMP